MNNIIWLVFDSARYDAFIAARTPAIHQIGHVERRFSYASWTAPSHYAFLMGLPPHSNEPGCFAADAHRRELARWEQRIGATSGPTVSFGNFVPVLSLPAFLKSLGYRTEAYVSLPVLNPRTLISQHFDQFHLMPSHNDLAAIVARLSFTDTPCFFFINTGETHYPYVLPHETLNDLPHVSGLHGVWRSLDEFIQNPSTPTPPHAEGFRFDTEQLRSLWKKQVACIEYLDGVVADLMSKVPDNTWFIITSDHGELFGEDGYFGHGPVMHEKVFEVFFVEGRVPRATEPTTQQKDETKDDERSVIMARLRQLGYA